MDFPMFYTGNPVAMKPGMVFFVHMILMDSESGNAQTLARTYIVGEKKAELLSKYPLDLIVR